MNWLLIFFVRESIAPILQQQTIKNVKSTTNYHKSNKLITQQDIAKKMVFTFNYAQEFNIFNNVTNKTLKVTFLGLLVIDYCEII